MSGSTSLSAISPDEFEQIEHALVESARGRWFLSEFARRNRTADTEMLLGAIGRLESAVVQGREQDREPEGFGRLRGDLMEMASAIARTKAEIAAISDPAQDQTRLSVASEALDAIVRSTERATSEILSAAEEVQETAWTLRERGVEAALCDGLDRHATQIYTACSFQDLTAQRTSRIVHTLRYLEERLIAMIGIWGEDAPVPPEAAAWGGAAPVAPDLSQTDVDRFIDMMPGGDDAAPRQDLSPTGNPEPRGDRASLALHEDLAFVPTGDADLPHTALADDLAFLEPAAQDFAADGQLVTEAQGPAGEMQDNAADGQGAAEAQDDAAEAQDVAAEVQDVATEAQDDAALVQDDDAVEPEAAFAQADPAREDIAAVPVEAALAENVQPDDREAVGAVHEGPVAASPDVAVDEADWEAGSPAAESVAEGEAQRSQACDEPLSGEPVSGEPVSGLAFADAEMDESPVHELFALAEEAEAPAEEAPQADPELHDAPATDLSAADEPWQEAEAAEASEVVTDGVSESDGATGDAARERVTFEAAEPGDDLAHRSDAVEAGPDAATWNPQDSAEVATGEAEAPATTAMAPPSEALADAAGLPDAMPVETAIDDAADADGHGATDRAPPVEAAADGEADPEAHSLAAISPEAPLLEASAPEAPEPEPALPETAADPAPAAAEPAAADAVPAFLRTRSAIPALLPMMSLPRVEAHFAPIMMVAPFEPSARSAPAGVAADTMDLQVPGAKAAEPAIAEAPEHVLALPYSEAPDYFSFTAQEPEVSDEPAAPPEAARKAVLADLDSLSIEEKIRLFS